MRAFLLASFAALLAAGAPSVPKGAEGRLRKDVALLASPDLAGRGNGDPGLEKAARHLLARYKAMGLRADVQRFPFVAKVTREMAEARLTFGDGAAPDLRWGQDVEAVGYSADADLRLKPLVFVGYGVTLPGRDDLEGLELKGKVPMILRKVPAEAPFDKLGAGDRTLLARIQRLAQAGAAAVIVLEDGEKPAPLQREEGPLRLAVPVLSMPVATAAQVCTDLPEQVAQAKAQGAARSRDYVTAPWSTLDLRLKLRREEVQLPNVIATIPGRDPKLRAEHLVLGAHLDHLGLGGRHSLGGAAARGHAHPGADDNASGTALLLELARQLKARPAGRSVTLMHFSGEEEGLLGSAHWVKVPTVPLDRVKLMLNFDMVGRLAETNPTLALGGLGAPKAALEEAKALAPAGLGFTKDMGAEAGGSDHMSFSAAKIPTFFFFTGLHTDYHRPTDTHDKVNVKGLALLAGYALEVTHHFGGAAQTPAFDPATAVIHRGTGSPMRVSFGTLPDYGEYPDGFHITGVSPGSTAEAIGLQGGDVLTDFGDKRLANIYDFMGALGAYKPGDVVVVKWLRKGQPMQATATLKGRQ